LFSKYNGTQPETQTTQDGLSSRHVAVPEPSCSSKQTPAVFPYTNFTKHI
jgi:hypothetical protein